MLIRSLAVALLVGSVCVHAAPAKETPVTSEEIDVDAMARAKDADTESTQAQATDANDTQSDAATDAGTPDEETVTAPPTGELPTDAESAPTDSPATKAAADTSTAAPTEDSPEAGTAVEQSADEAKHEGATAASPQDMNATAAPADEAAADEERRLVARCDARATGLLDAIDKGKYKEATVAFDAKMMTEMPPDKLKAAWKSLAQFGALQARGQSHAMKGEGYIAIVIPLLFEKQNLFVQVACGTDGRIAGFHIKPLEAPAE